MLLLEEQKQIISSLKEVLDKAIQGDFLLLEIAFSFIMQNENINDLSIFGKTFLYTTCADNTTVFLKDKIAFLFIMQNENINDLNIFGKTFLYTACADNTTVFPKDEKSVTELMKTFDIFSAFLDFNQTKVNKCEKPGLGALKMVKLALCGMECIDLMFNAIKILGVYYSYDKNLGNQDKLYKSSFKN